ncbi:hypothetical protein JXA40_07030 [bacterium]|nr:hypothetical protein [candidate division CSSED10-310 bacterium]
MKHLVLFFLIVILTGLGIPAVADPFVDAVVEVSYGTGSGFGQGQFPEIVMGPPQGGGEGAGSTDVLSLGDGGSIILEFTDNIARNGPGPDLIVFENPFYAGGSPQNVYVEAAFVEVSQDGENFLRFPNDYDPDGEPVNNPANWSGFAGVRPVLSHPENGIDPTDPETAGGDAFDFEDVGLEWVRYVRIVDTDEPPNAAFDDDGDEIYDPGWPSAETGGFDLDAVAAVHSEELTTPTPVPTQTPTPFPTGFSVDLQLTQSIFEPFDLFVLDLEIQNGSGTEPETWIVILLDVFGEYFFWPGWVHGFDGVFARIESGVTIMNIFDFLWPDVPGEAHGLAFWAALISEEFLLMSGIDRVEFGYRN